jgi:hypothetical protein
VSSSVSQKHREISEHTSTKGTGQFSRLYGGDCGRRSPAQYVAHYEFVLHVILNEETEDARHIAGDVETVDLYQNTAQHLQRQN